MKYLTYVVVFLSYSLSGQYTLDHTIRNHAFFKAVEADPDRRSILQFYYEPVGTPLQEQLKDTLRARFSDQELFEIARYSKIPFYRIAAFELYSQTDYNKDAVISFLKRGKISSSWHTPTDSVPEVYTPMPNVLLPGRAAIRLKMLNMLNPGALRRAQKNPDDSVFYVPAYPKTRPLDLERFVSLKTYMSYYCEDRVSSLTWRFVKPGEKPPKMPTFYMPDPEVDFGTIDLAYLDPAKTEFELRGAIKVVNNTSKPITLMGQASGHTMCLQGRYVIPAKQEMMIEFKSLVHLSQAHINRSITLTNVETDGAQMFTFKAQFIHTKS